MGRRMPGSQAIFGSRRDMAALAMSCNGGRSLGRLWPQDVTSFKVSLATPASAHEAPLH